MDKKEYDQIEERANKLQNEAERKCSQKIKEATEYKDGYVQGVEDLLRSIIHIRHYSIREKWN